MEIMATWVAEVESEFFNRWLVVGVPRGGSSWCHRCCLRSSSLRRLRGRSHRLCWHEALLCQDALFFSHPKLASPPPFHPAHPTGTPPPIWDVRPCCPTACPLSSGATCPPPPTPINLISLPLCSPPEHDFSSHSCNPHCDFATRRRCT